MVRMSRNSFLTSLGRFYQDISPLLSFIDYPFRTGIEPIKDAPAIFIVAPPRSGSTLTYQLLIHSFENIHLTNIWNLLYSMPALGARISERFCKNKKIEFSSKNGFVPGLCGEAEGMKFWEYWIGQGLVQHTSSLKNNRASKLSVLLNKLYTLYGRPFISGYLAHAFSIGFLRKHFPASVFIHVTRDFLENACSIYKVSPTKWFSLKPDMMPEDGNERHRNIVRQILSIHAAIFEQYDEDIFSVRYEDICNNPAEITDQIKRHAHVRGIDLTTKAVPPASFTLSRSKENMDEHIEKFQHYFEKEMKTYKDEEQEFFNQMWRQ
jgi:hypothetical protein